MLLKSLNICGIHVEEWPARRDEGRPGVVKIACEGCGQTHCLFCADPFPVTMPGGMVVDAYWVD